MNMARFLNHIFKKPIFMDWEKCLGCYYRGSIGNYSPCYQCKGNDQFKPEEYNNEKFGWADLSPDKKG